MGFVIDDIIIIASLSAALASGASGASLFSKGGDKTIRSFKNKSTGKIRRVKLDGELKGIDPVGTIGHINTKGPDYGKPVDSKGDIISSDNALERLGIGSYDAVKIASSMNTSITRMLNPRGADQIFKKTGKYGSMRDLTQTIIKDPDFMGKYMEELLKKGKYFDPQTYSPSKIVEILTNPANIAPIIQADPNKYKEIWDMINNKFPKYKIVPTIDEPWAKTKTDGGDPEDPPVPKKPDDKPIPKPEKPKKPEPPEEPPEGPKRPESDKRDPPDKEKDKPDKEKDKPKPIPTPTEIKEKEIEIEAKKKPPRQRVPQQWYPEYQFGGQNMLKLTDVEKIEELKNYSLFDLVNPLLEGDKDNLLAIQNKLKEKMRFSNTYANPKAEPVLKEPERVNWGYQMRDTRPVAYPFSLDQAHSNNYYDHFCSEYSTELNKTVDLVKRDHTFDPDVAKIANARREGYTATSKNIMPGNARFSLLEGIDSTNLNPLDLILYR